jgi:hypothetical protein
MRHFYRCNDCLTVMATDEEIKRTADERGFMRYGVCAACDGWISYMGRVEHHRVWHTEHVCPCDGRCTGASGPSCDCQCGGVNHGSGMLVPVDKSGPMPRFMAPPDARRKAEEYTRLCDAFETAWQAKYGDIVARKSAGEYIRNFSFYLEALEEWKAYNKACAMKTHGGRNKRLAELTDRLSRVAACTA